MVTKCRSFTAKSGEELLMSSDVFSLHNGIPVILPHRYILRNRFVILEDPYIGCRVALGMDTVVLVKGHFFMKNTLCR